LKLFTILENEWIPVKINFFLTALIWERESPRPYMGRKNYWKMPFQIRAAFLARPYLENDGTW
jgi:hypothetical protein